MTKKNYTHLTMVVDRSGSMGGIAKECSNSINNLFAEQAKVEGDLTVSLYEFDDINNKIADFVDIIEVPKYHLVPRNMTALNDAIGKAIIETGETLKNMPEALRPSKVIFNIVTDGHENASKEFDHKQVKDMIKEQTDKYGWEFNFMASNIDAQQYSAAYGTQSHLSNAHTAKGYAASYDTFSHALTATRGGTGTMASNIAAVTSEDEDVLTSSSTEGT